MKGYLYTVEVLIAISVISVTVIFLFKSFPEKPEMELSLIKTQGHDALNYLDKKGDLRQFVIDGNEDEIERLLSSLLDSKYELEICSLGQTCYDRVPANETIIAVDYYISGYREKYDAKKLRLFLWRKY